MPERDRAQGYLRRFEVGSRAAGDGPPLNRGPTARARRGSTLIGGTLRFEMAHTGPKASAYFAEIDTDRPGKRTSAGRSRAREEHSERFQKSPPVEVASKAYSTRIGASSGGCVRDVNSVVSGMARVRPFEAPARATGASSAHWKQANVEAEQRAREAGGSSSELHTAAPKPEQRWSQYRAGFGRVSGWPRISSGGTPGLRDIPSAPTTRRHWRDKHLSGIAVDIPVCVPVLLRNT